MFNTITFKQNFHLKLIMRSINIKKAQNTTKTRRENVQQIDYSLLNFR